VRFKVVVVAGREGILLNVLIVSRVEKSEIFDSVPGVRMCIRYVQSSGSVASTLAWAEFEHYIQKNNNHTITNFLQDVSSRIFL
jgi:hypothetical protein